MTTRRRFISASAVGGISLLLAKEESRQRELPQDLYQIIQKVQNHLFPKGTLLPSATLFGATDFLQETLHHSSYDRDIRAFVLKGAKKLRDTYKEAFLDYDEDQMEKALRKFEKTKMGDNWLSRVMILSIEALLSDPIYGGNFQELGWKALETMGGSPRPTSKYVAL